MCLSRLARRLVVQELAIKACKKRGIKLELASAPGLLADETPQGIFRRQSFGMAAELDNRSSVSYMADGRTKAKARSKVLSLKGAKKCEGRKNVLQLFPDFITQAGRVSLKSQFFGAHCFGFK